MIDVHAHIIPGIDDGARDLEEALEMARLAVRGGTVAMAAASHCDFSVWKPEEYDGIYEKQFRRLKRELQARRIPLRLCPGREFLLNESLLRTAREGRLSPVWPGGRILVEAYFDLPYVRAREYLEELLKLGYRPVLAHPERYGFAKRRPERLLELYRAGITLQVNAGSLLGMFGERAMEVVGRLLTWEIAGMLASDGHDSVLRTTDMQEAARILELYHGMAAARALLEENPARALFGRPGY